MLKLSSQVSVCILYSDFTDIRKPSQTLVPVPGRRVLHKQDLLRTPPAPAAQGVLQCQPSHLRGRKEDTEKKGRQFR